MWRLAESTWLLVWFSSAIIRLENYHYASQIGMCAEAEHQGPSNLVARDRCLNRQQTMQQTPRHQPRPRCNARVMAMAMGVGAVGAIVVGGAIALLITGVLDAWVELDVSGELDVLGLEVDGDLGGAKLALRPPLCSRPPCHRRRVSTSYGEPAVAGFIEDLDMRPGARLRLGTTSWCREPFKAGRPAAERTPARARPSP